MNKFIIKWKEEEKYFYQTAPTAIIDYHYFTDTPDKAYKFDLLDNAKEMIKELGSGTFVIEVLKPQTELEQFITYINNNLDKLREGSATRKAIYSIVRLYTEFRKGN